MTETYKSAGEAAQAIVAKVGPNIVLGLPIGVGKATHIADALFDLASDDPSLSLTIFIGLTLEPPQGRSEPEKRFVGPLVARLYGDWPAPRYAPATRDDARVFGNAYCGNFLATHSKGPVNERTR